MTSNLDSDKAAEECVEEDLYIYDCGTAADSQESKRRSSLLNLTIASESVSDSSVSWLWACGCCILCRRLCRWLQQKLGPSSSRKARFSSNIAATDASASSLQSAK